MLFLALGFLSIVSRLYNPANLKHYIRYYYICRYCGNTSNCLYILQHTKRRNLQRVLKLNHQASSSYRQGLQTFRRAVASQRSITHGNVDGKSIRDLMEAKGGLNGQDA